MINRLVAGCLALSLLTGVVPAASAKAPDTWDDLHRVKSPKLDEVYLLPEADFRAYTKIQIDPVEMAFQKNWLRDQNRSTMTSRISEDDAMQILEQGRAAFAEVLAKAYAAAGYQIVTEAGADVLRLRAAVINLSVNAPDRMSAGRSRTYSREAGTATLVLEVRDSTTGAVLGRAIDAREIGDSFMQIRNSVTNRSDFERAFEQWAKISVNGLAELKALSPIDAEANPARK